MCYSALVWASYQDYVRRFGAAIDIDEFVRLYTDQGRGRKIKTLKGMDDAVLASESRALEPARAALRVEQDLFEPSGPLDTLPRRESQTRDRRIFPGVYCPVLVWEDGRPRVKPMRYQCRPAGKPAFYDRRYPGTYNARRDKLGGFWKAQFGHCHGLVMFDAFYEHVARDAAERRAVLEFRPQDGRALAVACLWSRWQGEGETLLSFAAITDDPPPEIVDAGHDRCIIPIRAANIEAWLNPAGRGLAALQALLDDRERPYYEHRKAA